MLQESRHLPIWLGVATGLITVGVGAATTVGGLIFSVAAVFAPTTMAQAVATAAVLSIPAGVILIGLGIWLVVRGENN